MSNSHVMNNLTSKVTHFLWTTLMIVYDKVIGVHCVKTVHIRIYSGPYFPSFELNAERYRLSLRIQSKCEKIQTRITPNTDTFHAVVQILPKINPALGGVFRTLPEILDVLFSFPPFSPVGYCWISRSCKVNLKLYDVVMCINRNLQKEGNLK